MIHIFALILACINIIMAGIHANLIKAGKKIQHGWWGAGYLALLAVFYLVTKSWLLVLDGLLIRKVFFDLSLNIARKKPLFYVSSSTTSLIDKFHNAVFGKRSEVYMIIYFIGIIVVTILL